MLVGEAKILPINLGDLSFKLKDVDDVPENEWRPLYSDVFENPELYPSQSFHISAPGSSIMVDAGNYSLFASQDSSNTPKNYVPPPGLIEQLFSRGIKAESVTKVIITHAHYDHYSGVTTKKEEGSFVPTFPNAVHFLGRKDFENPELQKELSNPDSPDSQTFGALKKMGLLELVDSNLDISPEVRIERSPGESPGHQIVKVSSKGRVFYCVGDLFHHAVEVENPSWMPAWADRESNLASRLSLIDAALREDAILAPSHMSLGKLEHTQKGAKFINL